MDPETESYDVGIEAVSGDTGYAGSSCYNWILYFKYSAAQKRAALWDVGQEAQFPFTTVNDADCDFDYDCSADYLMASSFRFIGR